MHKYTRIQTRVLLTKPFSVAYDVGAMNKPLGKARITITLNPELLPLLDRFVDGEKIRNRSHAIEFILSNQLGVGIERAVIFAGANEQHDVYALTSVRNRPLIAYHFDLLKAHNIRDVLIVVDEYGSKLREFVGDGAQYGVRVVYAQDNERTGTAHALLLAKPFIRSTFLLLYSDSLADINLSDFAEHHRETDGAVGTVALTYKKSPEEYGVARMQGHKIVDYAEKPGKDSKHGLVNTGFYIFEPNIFDYIAPDSQWLETDVLPKVAASGALIGYPFEGRWFDISKASGRERAEKE